MKTSRVSTRLLRFHGKRAVFPALAAVFCFLMVFSLSAQEADGPRIEDYPYPYPVKNYTFESQRQTLQMAYMERSPAGSPKGAIVLLHGKNFGGSYWQETAEALAGDGYHVVMPDQIGFGKSSKPGNYHYTFQQLATNTRGLLRSLGVEKAHILGHSMGGMLAARYALTFPEATESLTLVNPIGLEDWKARGVPYATVDEWYQGELKQTPEKIRAYQLQFYYDNQWKPAYDAGVAFQAAFLRSPDYARMAWNQALTYDMIFTQPVVYEFPRIKTPALLIIGQRDRTALGKARAPREIQATLGDYPALGRAARDAIPGSRLVELDGLGHLPQVEDFSRFIAPLRRFMEDIR